MFSLSNRSLRKFLATVLIASSSLLVVHGCTLITSQDTKNGIGEPCKTRGDCQGKGALCSDGICTAKCSQDSDCPSPSTCRDNFCKLPIKFEIGEPCTTKSDCQGDNSLCEGNLCTASCSQNTDCPSSTICAGNLCQRPLKVGLVYIGTSQGEGWTPTHELGRQYAVQQLPYLQTEVVENTFLPEDASLRVDEFIQGGAQAIVLTSFSLRTVAQTKAEQYPNVKFLTCSSNDAGPNYGSYFGRSYQAWYMAGFAAGKKTKTDRLGFVGSFVTAEVVRHINAFALGARRANPKAVVEVRWEGFWFDVDPPDPVTHEYNETKLTRELIDTGCDVIGHNSDTARPVAAVETVAQETGKKVYSIGNDNIDGCKNGPNTCLGVPYWNWGPMYARMFAEIHKGTWVPSVVNESMTTDPKESILVFGTNDTLVENSLKVQLGELLAVLARPEGKDLPFMGPYKVTYADQRPEGGEIPAGKTIADEELPRMCWFVDGVITKTDLDDPASPDEPARVPDGTVVIGKSADGSELRPDCRINL